MLGLGDPRVWGAPWLLGGLRQDLGRLKGETFIGG